MRKPIENVLSGEQIVTGSEHDRVHGVSDPKNGVVTVRTDRSRAKQFLVGTIVEVV